MIPTIRGTVEHAPSDEANAKIETARMARQDRQRSW